MINPFSKLDGTTREIWVPVTEKGFYLEKYMDSSTPTAIKLSPQDFTNSPTCGGQSFADGSVLDMAEIAISGRYPEKGWARNLASHEMVRVLTGSGRLFLRGNETIELSVGDVVHVPPKTWFAWDGDMVILMACSPAFSTDQYEIMEDIDVIDETITLRPASEQDGEKELLFLKSVPQTENGFGRPANDDDLASLDNFKLALANLVRISHGESLEPDQVPQTIFWIDRGDDIVGILKIRHRLNDKLRNEGGGHIGIGGIRPEYRGQGIGTKALQLAIEKLRDMGEKDIIVSVHKDNIASRRVIQKNGGVFWKEIDDPKYAGVREQFYWIKEKG